MKKIALSFLALFLMGAMPAHAQTTGNTYYADDPLEGYNRFMFMINDFFDLWLIKPTAQVYDTVVPREAKNGIRNFIDNLGEPITAANELLQGEGTKAGQSVFRFVVNSIGGIGGVFEVADDIGYPRRDEDFGQTLAVWGVPEGAYIVLPLFGPSTLRDTAGLATDIYANPVRWIADEHDAEEYQAGMTVVNIIDRRARNLDRLDNIRADSLDYYAAIRSLYLQNRRAEIQNRNDRLESVSLEQFDFNQ